MGRTSINEPGRNARIDSISTVKPPFTLPLMTPMTTSSAKWAASKPFQASARFAFLGIIWFPRTVLDGFQSHLHFIANAELHSPLALVN
ncbi:MAG: hypothetical protein CM15mP74_02680 [Halieaceae bacterium]|nr:MAG: hypothetical protein CM15mP74_02680 [Halieaceae bacterium]